MLEFTPEKKLALDPNYYPPNYAPGQEEDSTPSLMNNLVPLLDKLTDQEEDTEQNNKDGEEAEEAEDGREDLTKTHSDSEQEAYEEEDDLWDYSDLVFIYWD